MSRSRAVGHRSALNHLNRVRYEDRIRAEMAEEAAGHIRLKHRADWEAFPPPPRGRGGASIGGPPASADAPTPPPAPFGTSELHPDDDLELYSADQRRCAELRRRAARREAIGAPPEGFDALPPPTYHGRDIEHYAVRNAPRPPPFAVGEVPPPEHLGPSARRATSPPFARGDVEENLQRAAERRGNGVSGVKRVVIYAAASGPPGLAAPLGGGFTGQAARQAAVEAHLQASRRAEQLRRSNADSLGPVAEKRALDVWRAGDDPREKLRNAPGMRGGDGDDDGDDGDGRGAPGEGGAENDDGYRSGGEGGDRRGGSAASTLPRASSIASSIHSAASGVSGASASSFPASGPGPRPARPRTPTKIRALEARDSHGHPVQAHTAPPHLVHGYWPAGLVGGVAPGVPGGSGGRSAGGKGSGARVAFVGEQGTSKACGDACRSEGDAQDAAQGAAGKDAASRAPSPGSPSAAPPVTFRPPGGLASSPPAPPPEASEALLRHWEEDLDAIEKEARERDRHNAQVGRRRGSGRGSYAAGGPGREASQPPQGAATGAVESSTYASTHVPQPLPEVDRRPHPQSPQTGRTALSGGYEAMGQALVEEEAKLAAWEEAKLKKAKALEAKVRWKVEMAGEREGGEGAGVQGKRGCNGQRCRGEGATGEGAGRRAQARRRGKEKPLDSSSPSPKAPRRRMAVPPPPSPTSRSLASRTVAPFAPLQVEMARRELAKLQEAAEDAAADVLL